MAAESSKKPIRIAHLQLLPLLSGVQRVTLSEVTRLDRNHFEPFVVCKEEGPLTEALRTAKIPYFCVPELVREISPILDAKALWRLTRLFREQRFDVVHTHSSKTGILGRLAGKLAGVPLVMHTVHGYAFPAAKGTFQSAFYFLMEWIGARLTDVLILLNKHDLELAERRLGVPARKLQLLPNGVDVTRFSPVSTETRDLVRSEVFKAGPNQVVVGMVGRLWEQKNPEGFVKAAIQILESGLASVSFFLIGDGEKRELLETIIKKSGYERGINILGWRDDVDRLLGGLDIFVLPSKWEGMPLVILEAMASSLPVVVSDIPGNRDLVDDGQDGLIFELNREESLIEKLSVLLKDMSLVKRLGARGREKMLSHYRLEGRVNKMEHLYLGTFGKKDPRGDA